MRKIHKTIDQFLVRLGCNHVVGPTELGRGPHDCALTSMYWAVPKLQEVRISEAIGYCSENWPFGGVTNKEFAIALKYLGIKSTYCDREESLEEILKRRPARCAALLYGHFVAILKGKLVGNDRHLMRQPNATVYCHWTFH